ncbi:MAG: HAD family phosphatase, partial [Deltaproteobacteria bacterium]
MATANTFELDPARVRAAVFDFGGVLMEGGPTDVVAFGTRLGLDRDAWLRLRADLFGNDGPWAELERGEISLDRFVDELHRSLLGAGIDVSRDEAAAFMGTPEPMSAAERLRPALIEEVRRLRRRMPTALLTNNVREWREGWRSLIDVDSLFDVVVDSSEVGTRKPERRIYEITRERLGVGHDEIFFVDDIGQNLKAARSLGWQTYLYTDADALRNVLG